MCENQVQLEDKRECEWELCQKQFRHNLKAAKIKGLRRLKNAQLFAKLVIMRTVEESRDELYKLFVLDKQFKDRNLMRLDACGGGFLGFQQGGWLAVRANFK